ncbi:YgiQ family radical SAM protein [Pseudobutyrivibrio xylanivorans]|uniref:YgiQ family radical SAM protein n=1 Tax=Pseudobutyrivibrio xylanivorans TaxID=185007 RepID=A0A5P6VSL1_PSEXY|nr:YgiQ family radical SAM protein [Pseudobutyrivibrio xylanivorans]QFJ55637.1 YgiQ family radical SAM protein [Pseudobutyrivibrio xylanivorans]
MQRFLPVSKQDMKERGIDQLDFVYVCGDAYVDHPSFGAAIICRILELHGYSVGFIGQPDWKDDNSINILGEPKYGFFVSAGNMDSMVNHYSVSKHRRDFDNYSPGGKIGLRPDYATIVYCNLIRHTYKTKPIIIGGIEASLRRLAHYDYWSNKVRRSILLDSGADIISYGMGERTIVEIADCLASGMDVKDITYLDGTVFKTRDKSFTEDAIILPSYEDIKADKKEYAKSFYTQYVNTDAFTAKKLVETYDGAMFVVQNPPQKPLSRQEMDDVYAIEYMRTYHPMYEKDGGIPAIKEVKFSLISNRGCFGGCNFCALTFHQGRIIQSRSQESIVEEAKLITQDPDFKGYIHDVGGPTANFRNPSCKKQLEKGVCMNRQCLFPTKCPNLQVDHKEYVQLLTKLRKLPKVKKVFVRSGVRFDYVMYDKDDTFLRDLCKYHISGQLKVAPEHISNNVLSYLGKPDISVYNAFCDKYAKINKELGLKQYLVPYLMSSHPGSTLDDAIALAEYLRDHHLSPEQVQDFYPTPSTISTTMYYTEIDPRDMKPVYVCKNPHEKAMQRALIQYKRPENYDLVKEALMKAGREDLIGFGEECLIPPRKIKAREFKGKDIKAKDSKAKDNKTKDFGKNKPKTNNKNINSKDNKHKNERTKNKRKR